MRVIVALGGFAWRAALRLLGNEEWAEPPSPAKPKFGHGVVAELASGRQLLGCYHPSQQNMFTGRLTPAMLDDVFADARRRPGSSRRRVVLNSSCDFPYSTWSRSAATRPRRTRWRPPCGSRRPPTGSASPATGWPNTTTCLAVAATSPPVLIAYLAAQTTQLRLGSGGVMLPNHARWPSPSSSRCWRPPRRAASTWASAGPRPDPVTSIMLRGTDDGADVENFPQYLDDVAALMARAACGSRSAARTTSSRPPRRDRRAADLAARFLAVFGASGGGQRPALVCSRTTSPAGHGRGAGVYCSEFRPSDLAAEPVTFMTVNAVVAPTRSEAEALLLPNLQLMARLRTGQPLGPLDLVEDAATTTMAPQAGAIVAAARDRVVVGAPSRGRRPDPFARR